APPVRDSATAIGVVLGLLYLFPIMAQVVSDPHWQRHLQQLGPMPAGVALPATPKPPPPPPPPPPRPGGRRPRDGPGRARRLGRSGPAHRRAAAPAARRVTTTPRPRPDTRAHRMNLRR